MRICTAGVGLCERQGPVTHVPSTVFGVVGRQIKGGGSGKRGEGGSTT